ncbi:MAG: hypothetical protein SFU98_19050 [Leptospiraceae bacterium]|nr:hypothetical protein [Leptospiraceae bacterium]
MINNVLKKLGKNKNWVRSSDAISGLENNFFINIGNAAGLVYILLNNLEISDEKLDLLVENFEKNKKELGYSKFGGKLGYYTNWILVFSNILIILISNYVSIGFLIYWESLKFDETIYMLFNHKEIIDIVFKNILMSMVLCLIAWGLMAYKYYQSSKFPEYIESKVIQ